MICALYETTKSAKPAATLFASATVAKLSTAALYDGTGNAKFADFTSALLTKSFPEIVTAPGKVAAAN